MFGGIKKLVGALGTIRKIAVGTLLIGGVGTIWKAGNLTNFNRSDQINLQKF